MVLFGFILYGTLCPSRTWMSVSFSRLRNFSAIISLSKLLPLSLSLFLFLPGGEPGTSIIEILACLMLSQRSLKLFPFFKIIFSVLLGWFTLLFQFADLLPKSSNLVYFLPSICFISVILFFISAWFLLCEVTSNLLVGGTGFQQAWLYGPVGPGAGVSLLVGVARSQCGCLSCWPTGGQ